MHREVDFHIFHMLAAIFWILGFSNELQKILDMPI